DVLANDTDVDGGTKTIASKTDGLHGTVVNNGTDLTYQPAATYCNSPPATALDSFTYTLNGGSSANVTVTVTCPLAASKVLFVTTRDGNSEIYSMNADGTGATRLTNDSRTDTEPAWSPDQTKIAFSSNRNGSYEIYVMNAN